MRQAAFLVLLAVEVDAPLVVSNDTPCFEGVAAPLLHWSEARWKAEPTLSEPGSRLTLDLFDRITASPAERQRASVNVNYRGHGHGGWRQIELVYAGGQWQFDGITYAGGWMS
ncbi:MAG: hypothetical protein JW940_14190 [Polyangiaceae bacterium]|nr:hypothetical protein [Polyangiaceae bacterium]